MSFTKKVTDFVAKPEQKTKGIHTGESQIRETGVKLKINTKNIFAPQDYAKVINTFESGAAEWEEEDYNSAYHYKDVFNTKQFSKRVQSQMEFYPGMHQATNSAKEDPSYYAARKQADKRLGTWESSISSPDSFMSTLRSRQQDFDYSKIFSSDNSAKDKAVELGKMMTECVPCFKRITDLEGLLPDGDLLEVHALNTKIRMDFLGDIKDLFNTPGMYVDICEIIKLLSSLCPQDLFAIGIVFSQYLLKLNLQVKFNIDFIISLVGSILSPFLDALTQWLDKWIQLILEPVICVVDHINEVVLLAQDAKIPMTASISSSSNINIALPGQQNVTANEDVGVSSGDFSSWSDTEFERFSTPDNEKYNTPVPSEVEFGEQQRLILKETKDAYISSTPLSEKEDRWDDFEKAKKNIKDKVANARAEQIKRSSTNGTRWSKDNIPESEKNTAEYKFDRTVRPPEKQDGISDPDKYFTPHAMISSVVHMRNLLQSIIAYMKDWFTYITQMIYDLLGTEIGWMKNKSNTTKTKNDLIQIIKIIKAIVGAINKNGLKCGKTTNLDPDQIKFITEGELNKLTDYNFKVLDNGDIKVGLPGQKIVESAKDNSTPVGSDSEKPSSSQNVDSSIGNVKVGTDSKQTSQKSSIIVKSCFNQTDVDNIKKVSTWIDYFERRLSNETNS